MYIETKRLPFIDITSYCRIYRQNYEWWLVLVCARRLHPQSSTFARANAQVILGNVSMPMQADARVFVNGEISYAEQLRDGSVANDIPHYVIRMSGLLRSFCDCFGIRNTLSVLTSPGSQNTCKFGAAAVNNATLCGLQTLVRRGRVGLFGYPQMKGFSLRSVHTTQFSFLSNMRL